jgi:hypothetical protein
MLTADNDVRVAYEPAWSGPGWLVVYVGEECFRTKRMHREQFRSNVYWSKQIPQRVARINRRVCWMFKGNCFWAEDGLSQHQVHALLKGSAAQR